MREYLEEGLAALGLDPPPGAAAALEAYAGLLLEQNKVMNLTAITAPDQVAALHLLDSAALLKAADLAGRRIIDVGTGAGFPGLVLKVLEPTLTLTLLDSLGKRVDWLAAVGKALGVDGVEYLHARAEEQGLVPGYREGFDAAVSRAVAELRFLCELCLPFVKVGGLFLAMKSTDCEEELTQAEGALRLLGGTVRDLWDYTIPGTQVRHRVVCVEKTAPTPGGYPRRWAKMKRAPL
ncbi:MAG: 16S rRNA (guanine(527)-N(7))-methyltransferase RsmG [Clostridiales bacterium]|nr:16S rRNA (guanine(527)-N(7))-methyltransferase RsmG [Clostridiales bacterium]